MSLYNCRCLPSHAIVKRYLLLSIIDSICNIALFRKNVWTQFFKVNKHVILFCLVLGCLGLFGVRLSWTVWCQAVSDCLVSGCLGLFGVRLSWTVWCQAVFGLLGVRLSWTVWCQAVLDCLVSGCPGLFGVRLSSDCLVSGCLR